METTVRSLKRWEHILHDWRGSQVWAIAGQQATIRVLFGASFLRDRVVDLDLLPSGARSVGCPLVVKIVGGNPDTFTVSEIHESTFQPQDAPRDNARSVAEGRFSPGVVTPREGADWTPWWTA